MFVHNINPVLLKIGFFEIRYYSLVYIFGFLLAYFLLLRVAKDKKVKGLTKQVVEDFMVYLMLGSIIGARLLYFVFYNPAVLWTNPFEVFFLWHGGMSFHGGLIGVIVAYFVFRRKHNVAFYDLADILVLPFAFTLFLGRIANFINGELWGTLTNVSWCVKFPGVEGCRHPSQLYEALKNLFVFGILFSMKNVKKLKKGVVFWSFILLYGFGRFITDFWREETQLLGVSMGQFLSLVMVVVAIVYLYKLRK
ncbi:MAG: prolipoprotein diacylglyceryl transferase [Nanoarchaeota archaeon]|nr:prolipoprotein diacylglyceryl transferase [Nanoarchaeota archaeon]MBU1855315.1 prolipoprotein diacylglyceryl transferase [Nanoarchaeota archaeon]